MTTAPEMPPPPARFLQLTGGSWAAQGLSVVASSSEPGDLVSQPTPARRSTGCCCR